MVVAGNLDGVIGAVGRGALAVAEGVHLVLGPAPVAVGLVVVVRRANLASSPPPLRHGVAGADAIAYRTGHVNSTPIAVKGICAEAWATSGVIVVARGASITGGLDVLRRAGLALVASPLVAASAGASCRRVSVGGDGVRDTRTVGSLCASKLTCDGPVDEIGSVGGARDARIAVGGCNGRPWDVALVATIGSPMVSAGADALIPASND